MSTINHNRHVDLRRWLLRYFLSVAPGVALLGFISILVVGFELLEPWPIKLLIDSVFGTTPLPNFLSGIKKTDQLVLLAAFSIVFVYGIETLLTFIKSQFTNWLALKLDFKIASDFFNRVQRLSLAVLSKGSSGDYVYRQNTETGAISALLIDVVDELFISFLTVAGISIVMMSIDIQLSVIGFVIIPLLYLSIRVFSKRIERHALRVEESNSRLYSYTTESVENVKLIQSFGKERSRLEGLQRLMRFNIKFKLRYSLTDEGFTLTNDILATVAMAILIIIGSHKVIDGELTVGGLLIFLTYLSDLYSPLQSISTAIGAVKTDMASAKRVFSVFATKNNVVSEVPNPIKLVTAKGHIQFRNVSFSYGGEVILRNINLDIPPGQKVAFIGPSGTGKSTLLSLLPRFYDYQQGEILFDGVDITKYELKSLRQQFSIVAQEAPLLATSVLNNITFASTDGLPSSEEVIRAAKAANAYDFIKRLPEGFSTELSDRGSNISGGQRQRIAIARAFLRESPILLLDEPTSSLDAVSESAVVGALDTLMEGRTTLIVSHNRGTLQNADVIYVMDNGEIVEGVTRNDTERFNSLISATKTIS